MQVDVYTKERERERKSEWRKAIKRSMHGTTQRRKEFIKVFQLIKKMYTRGQRWWFSSFFTAIYCQYCVKLCGSKEKNAVKRIKSLTPMRCDAWVTQFFWKWNFNIFLSSSTARISQHKREKEEKRKRR